MKHPKRTCQKCKSPILKSHRWHFVHKKFLWWTITRTEHRDCIHPTRIHPRVTRLDGEVPLPFDGPLNPVAAVERVGMKIYEESQQ